MRKTRIICTLSPASETIREMIAAGADVFRLNMIHAKHDWVRDIVPRVRALPQELGYGVAILLESMIENPLPTRAEVTGVANAVFEQADAIRQTGETTSGRYPVRCVESWTESPFKSSAAEAATTGRMRCSAIWLS